MAYYTWCATMPHASLTTCQHAPGHHTHAPPHENPLEPPDAHAPDPVSLSLVQPPDALHLPPSLPPNPQSSTSNPSSSGGGGWRSDGVAAVLARACVRRVCLTPSRSWPPPLLLRSSPTTQPKPSPDPLPHPPLLRSSLPQIFSHRSSSRLRLALLCHRQVCPPEQPLVRMLQSVGPVNRSLLT
jgi:hypothetical protein